MIIESPKSSFTCVVILVIFSISFKMMSLKRNLGNKTLAIIKITELIIKITESQTDKVNIFVEYFIFTTQHDLYFLIHFVLHIEFSVYVRALLQCLQIQL